MRSHGTDEITLRLFVVTILLFGTFAILAADPVVGTWIGTAHQSGQGQSSSYQVEMKIISPSEGATVYPSLSCGGSLAGGKTGDVYRFRESITYGKVTGDSSGCIDGDIEISVHGNSMSWHWTGSYEGESIVSTATLTRAEIESATWSSGKWKRGDSVANVLGTCFTAWRCGPGSEIVRSSDSRLLTTKAKRTSGSCQVTDNPEECGRCLSHPPEERCEYCVEPAACSDPNLGPRTREGLGCCPSK